MFVGSALVFLVLDAGLHQQDSEDEEEVGGRADRFPGTSTIKLILFRLG